MTAFVAGVDFSETMLHMATRRCAPLVATGRAQLELADSSHLPFPDEHFEKAYSVHTLYFWKDPAEHLREIHRVLRPGGRLALGFRELATDRVIRARRGSPCRPFALAARSFGSVVQGVSVIVSVLLRPGGSVVRLHRGAHGTKGFGRLGSTESGHAS